MELYRQTSTYTGAAAALLMALHARKPDTYPLDREQEFQIWMRCANLPTRSLSIYAMAQLAQESGIPAHVVVGEKEYDYPDYRFQRYKKIEISDAKYTSRLHAKHARTAGVRITEREFTLEDVREHLARGAHIILRVNAGVLRATKATSKYVVVYGHTTEGYAIADPEQGLLIVHDENMEAAFETLVTKKKRDNRMIVLG